MTSSSSAATAVVPEHPQEEPRKAGIMLVVPPFQSAITPALGVSQLKANLDVEGFATEILYPNLRFAERIGINPYEFISQRIPTFVGDFVFSHLLFHRHESELESYIDEILKDSDVAIVLAHYSPGKNLVEILQHLIGEARGWLDKEVANILARDPWMVGLTSTFQQNCASLALISRIKKLRPEIVTVMGGANCEGEMGEELFARFQDIDYMGQGECDHSFVELVRSLHEGKRACAVGGFLSREGQQEATQAEILDSAALERMPYPNFADYFAQLPTVDFAERVVPSLVMETSRGCWWGAKQHCTFCGLNREGMAYRSKSGSRALDEMTALVRRYNVPRISVVDNILDMKYFKSILPTLAERPIAEMFYETKSNLSKRHVRLLAEAKVTWIQPGIESFSDQSLKLMRKGATKLQNIQLLKWSMESGLRVGWNYLFGFPGESEEELNDIMAEIEAIHHLEPPGSTIVLNLNRFSPYFDSPEQFGLGAVGPAQPYRHIFPFPEESLARIAYFYDSEFFSNKAKSDAFEQLRASTYSWFTAYRRSHLIAIPRKRSLIIVDSRRCAKRRFHRLTSTARRVYEACDEARGLVRILDAVGGEASSEEVQSILDGFVHDKLMLKADQRYLSLATEALESYRTFPAILPIGALLPQEPGSARDYVMSVLTLQKAPHVVARAMMRKAWKCGQTMAGSLRSRTLRALVRLVRQSPPSKPSGRPVIEVEVS